MSSSLSATSLAVTVAHAVTYLTRPLATASILPPTQLATLQAALEANLAGTFAATWSPAAPTRGAGRRVLSFAPGAVPPRPVYKACAAAGVEWTNWSRLLGGFEFELLVDPGCVSVRIPAGPAGPWGAAASSQARVITVWADAQQQQQQQQQFDQSRNGSSSSLSSLASSSSSSSSSSSNDKTMLVSHVQPTSKKTPAQLLIEADAADDEALFCAIAAEMHAPVWRTPCTDSFPVEIVHPQQQSQQQLRVPRRPAMHSRSSSRSSVVSAAPSFISDDSSVSSCASLSSVASASSSSIGSIAFSSRRTRAPRVFVDATKTDVTPYDGGKTTVLTGGVMLGAAPSRNSRAATGRRTARF